MHNLWLLENIEAVIWIGAVLIASVIVMVWRFLKGRKNG